MSSLSARRSRPFQSGARRTTRLKVSRDPWLPLASASMHEVLGRIHTVPGQDFSLGPGAGHAPYSRPDTWALDPATNSTGGLPNRPDKDGMEGKARPKATAHEPEEFWSVLDELTGSFSGPRDWSENLDAYLYGESD